MRDEGSLEAVAEHRCDERCAQPVRCIICNRIKSPRGVAVPVQLTGMRCDDRCAGYLIDPQAGHQWPAFVPHEIEAPVEQLVGSAVGVGGGPVTPTTSSLPSRDPVELLAWALHQAHPLAPRRRAARPPVTYRLACLLMGGDADEVFSRLVRAGCSVRQVCEALGSVVLEVSGDPVAIIAELDRWDRSGSIEIVPPPPAELRTPPPAR